MLWNARIAADFGLRSFEVLGFGRATRFVFRQRGLGKVGKDAYGHLLAEFLFRQRCTATKTECLPAFLHEILVWQSEHPNKKVFETKLQDCIPNSVLADFSALIGDEEGEGSNLEPEPVRLHSRVVGRELCEANPCEAGVVGKKKLVEQEWWEENCVKQTLVKQEWWERNAWWSRSGGKRTV